MSDFFQKHKLLGFGVSLAILLVVIFITSWLFQRFAETSYIVWYLKNGTVISFAAAFVAVLWDGMVKDEKLLSAHPGVYLVGCLTLTLVFFHSLTVYTDPRNRQWRRLNKVNATVEVRLGLLWNDLMTILFEVIIMLLVVGWLIVAAPLNYFVVLFTGAIARRASLGTLYRPILIKKGDNIIELSSQITTEPLPSDADDISLGRKPFATTQSLTGLFLWIADKVFN